PSRAIEAALAGLSLMAPKKADVLGVKAGESRRKEIFFITDMCSNSFGGDLSDLAQALKRPEGDSSIGAPNVYVIDVGEASTANIAVRAVRISRGKVSIETPLRIALEVVNYGTKAVKDIAVEMKMEDKPVGKYGEDATKITLQPGEVRLVEFPYTPYRSGILTGQASITSKEKNAVTWDDHYFFCLEVRESISVLCIDGDESGRGAESDAFGRAIIASAPGQGHPLFTTRFVNASKSADQVLAFYDVVAMINPGVIPADTVQAAVEFVEHGGGLVIFLGDLVKAEAFQGLANAVLPDAAEEEKFLPIAIAETIDALKLTGAPVRLAHCDFSLPLFRPFRDPANGDPTALAAYRFRKMIFAEEAPVTTVASFSDGSPAIVERKFGRGKVIIVATTPNKRWTNFPTSPVFLTFARAMVGAARRGNASSAARYYFSGDVFQITTKAERLKRGTEVVQPGGQPLLSRVIDSDFERRILGRAGQASGIYKVMLEIDAEDMEGEAGEKLTFRPVDSFAVNLPPSESSLSRLNAKGMTKEMGGNVQVVALEEGWVGAISSERQGRQLGWYAFVALLALLTLEGFVAWLKKTTEVRQGATAK
ncbi:MAG: hypothetical protein QF662_03955, partial [Phycisphaerae bacterium]|nr:hypothetical protein [Phycisphaerae bacterium]